MSKIHCTSATPFPPLEKDQLRVYSMRFCPYAERVLLVLAHKQLPYDLVNINLRDKPDWFLDKNPNGNVPVLQINDQIVYESSVCMNYIDDAFPGPRLTPSDPYVKARGDMLGDNFNQVIGSLFAAFRSDEAGKAGKAQELVDKLQAFEKLLPDSTFFGGDEVSMVDYFCWPFVAYLILARLTDNEAGQTRVSPRISQWATRMAETPAVRATRLSPDQHLAFLRSLKSGPPVYDIGLQ